MPSFRTSVAVMLALLGAWTGSPARASAQGIDLQQGWKKPQSEAFWYRSQGSRIMRFSWFKWREQEKSESLLSDLAFLESVGFIPAPGHELPIGFARDTNLSGRPHMSGR